MALLVGLHLCVDDLNAGCAEIRIQHDRRNEQNENDAVNLEKNRSAPFQSWFPLKFNTDSKMSGFQNREGWRQEEVRSGPRFRRKRPRKQWLREHTKLMLTKLVSFGNFYPTVFKIRCRIPFHELLRYQNRTS